MNHYIDHNEIKIEVCDKSCRLIGGAMTHIYRVKATHVPTGVYSIGNGYMSVYEAAESSIEYLQKEVYLHKIHNNEYNRDKFMEGI